MTYSTSHGTHPQVTFQRILVTFLWRPWICPTIFFRRNSAIVSQECEAPNPFSCQQQPIWSNSHRLPVTVAECQCLSSWQWRSLRPSSSGMQLQVGIWSFFHWSFYCSWFRSGLPHGRIYVLLLEAWSELRNDVTNARRWHPPRRRSPLLSGIDAQILGFPDPPKSKSPCQIFDFHIVLKQQLVTNSRILDEHDIGCHCIIKNFVKLLEFFLLSSNIFLYRNHPVEVLPILRWWYSPECLRLRYTNTLTRLLHKRIIAWGITDQEMKKFHKVDSKVLHQ